MKRIINILFLSILLPLCAQASLETADEDYMKGNYEQAVEEYETVLSEGGNAAAYYNLGNAYYRLENLGKAILNYERALILEPDNQDIIFNLSLAQAKTADQYNKTSEMFFITWTRDLVNSKTPDQWGKYGILLLLISTICFLVYRLSSQISVRKISFFSALIGLFLTIVVNIAAAWDYYSFLNDNRAVVINKSGMFKTSDTQQEAIRELNPGTIVEVTDENSRGWCEIIIPNGKKGWVRLNDITKIVEQ